MFSDEHLFAIALRRAAFVGDQNFRKIVGVAGSAEAAWKLTKKPLLKIDGIGEGIAKDIGNDEHLKFAEKELNFCDKNQIKILLRHRKELPFLLSECDDAPAILYQKGNTNSQQKPLSIVGTRNITAYGKHFIEDFLDHVKSPDLVTVSGLALGVDAEVHEKSLDKNISTIGVLAHGFHTFYPAKNRKLAERILEKGGALFTEFNSSQKPDRENFIQRNRIIAGISPATLVVETAFGGGSVSTVTFANNYNRDVYALPGKITDKYSQGCNHLIFQNKAAAISTIKDLADLLNLKNKEATAELFPKSEIRPVLSELQLQIFEHVKTHPNINLDDLSENLGIPAYKILPVLLELEISGYIKSLSGRQFLAN